MSLPSREDEMELHRRLVEKDPVAPSLIAQTYIGPLSMRLRANHPDLRDEHCIMQATADALLSYIKDPTQFAPEKARSETPLFSYLAMAAHGDLLNLLVREKRQRGNRAEEPVEDLAEGGNIFVSKSPVLKLVVAEEVADAEAVVREAEVGLDDREKTALRLMIDGERCTEEFASVLGIEHLPKEEQEKIVYRFKDRMKHRLKRGGERHGRST